MAETGTKNKCKVFLLSGFLGSGKTTMLQNLLETVPEGEKAAVLMNEFGKAGVDGDVVKKKGLEIIEISRGSIFCACAKGDFLKALYAIFRDYDPTVLLIEASGVADTTDIKRDLGHGRLSDFYKLEGNICLYRSRSSHLRRRTGNGSCTWCRFLGNSTFNRHRCGQVDSGHGDNAACFQDNKDR